MATKMTQPYRNMQDRAPSQILDTMRAGKMKGAPGAALMHASNQAKSKTGSGKRYMPRWPSSR